MDWPARGRQVTGHALPRRMRRRRLWIDHAHVRHCAPPPRGSARSRDARRVSGQDRATFSLGDPVNIEAAFEVVGLVLEATGEQPGSGKAEGLSTLIDSGHFARLKPGYDCVLALDRKAAFDVVDESASLESFVDQARIDHDATEA